MNEEQNTTPTISVSDVEAAIRIIDVSVQRGAIRGEEMLAVGTIRQRFADFHKYVIDAQGKQDIDQAGETEESAE